MDRVDNTYKYDRYNTLYGMGCLEELKMNKDRILQEEILHSVMREMQKDFYDDKWWKNKKVDKLPLIMGIWEFREEALELGFTIGMS